MDKLIIPSEGEILDCRSFVNAFSSVSKQNAMELIDRLERVSIIARLAIEMLNKNQIDELAKRTR